MKRWIALAVMLLLGAGMVLARTSQENRQDSYILVGVTPIGIDVPTLLTSPIAASALEGAGFTDVSVVPLVTLGAYLGRSLLVALDYGSTKATYTDKDTGTKGDLAYTNVGAYARWFVGNSFNILLAAHERTWTIAGSSEETDPIYGKVNVNAKLAAKATVGSIGIGNQWLTDFGLVIGLDWLVGSGVIGSTSTATLGGSAVTPLGTVDLTQLDPATTAAAKKSMTEAGDTLNTVAGAPGLFILTIGWSF